MDIEEHILEVKRIAAITIIITAAVLLWIWQFLVYPPFVGATIADWDKTHLA
jgi:hypothetical protein